MMHRVSIWTLVPLLALAAAGCKEKAAAPTAPPMPVVAAKVIVRDTPIVNEVIGQTRGATEIDVQARVEGVLESIHFSEGMPVTQGQLLYTIDPKPYEASLSQARANAAKAEAAALKSRQDVERFQPLLEKRAISRQQYDDAVAAEQANRAAVDAAKAVVESAEIQLGYTRITSPIAGLAGKSEVSLGNLVGRGQPTLLTRISQLNPIHVRFSVSEKEYLAWRRQYSAEDANAGRDKEIFDLVLADGTAHPHKGKVAFADREVDPTTGTLMLEVAFPNPDGVVRPGQYARVRYPLEVKKDAVLVPQRAVVERQATFSVVVVRPDNTAEFRPVKPGARIGSLWVIDQGLAPGDTIVLEGLQKLGPGSPVAVTLTNLHGTATSP